MRSTAAIELGNDQLQQLLDRATHLPAHSSWSSAGMPAVLLRGPPRHERIDMNR